MSGIASARWVADTVVIPDELRVLINRRLDCLHDGGEARLPWAQQDAYWITAMAPHVVQSYGADYPADKLFAIIQTGAYAARRALQAKAEREAAA